MSTADKQALWHIFHTLWGRAVGTADYDKKQWQELQRMIEDVLCKLPMDD
jgi:hypothetical protein